MRMVKKSSKLLAAIFKRNKKEQAPTFSSLCFDAWVSTNMPSFSFVLYLATVISLER